MKIGRPYQVAGKWYAPADDRGYDEVGLASWYGVRFHGGPTANGERFDMGQVGAAHKTLPLPSYVEVTALDSGRRILVRINDRGPFVANRIIDLSHHAAELLGIERSGVARVRVRRVFPDDAQRLALRSGRAAEPLPYVATSELAALDARFAARPADPPAPPRVAVAVPLPGWFVQAAAFADRTRAEAAAQTVGGRIEQAGALWRVRVGPFADQPAAQDALARVSAQGYQDAALVHVPATGS